LNGQIAAHMLEFFTDRDPIFAFAQRDAEKAGEGAHQLDDLRRTFGFGHPNDRVH
jgi:hypothetical protein